jgi:hypothetical protein
MKEEGKWRWTHADGLNLAEKSGGKARRDTLCIERGVAKPK